MHVYVRWNGIGVPVAHYDINCRIIIHNTLVSGIANGIDDWVVGRWYRWMGFVAEPVNAIVMRMDVVVLRVALAIWWAIPLIHTFHHQSIHNIWKIYFITSSWTPNVTGGRALAIR